MNSQVHQDRITEALRDLLASGRSLGDALRELHGVQGIGLMWLVPAVVSVCELSRPEAQRAVIQETFALRYP